MTNKLCMKKNKLQLAPALEAPALTIECMQPVTRRFCTKIRKMMQKTVRMRQIT